MSADIWIPPVEGRKGIRPEPEGGIISDSDTFCYIAESPFTVSRNKFRSEKIFIFLINNMWVERDREVIRSKVEPRTEFRVVSSTIPGSPVIIAMGQTGIQCVLKMERIKSTPDRITTQVMREGCGRHGTFPPLSAMSL